MKLNEVIIVDQTVRLTGETGEKQAVHQTASQKSALNESVL